MAGRPLWISNVHIPNAQMTRVAIEYPAQEFIHQVACPSLPVTKDSDKYYKFKKSHLNKVDDRRAIGAKAQRIIWEIDSTPTYVCEAHVLESVLPDEIRDNTDPSINADIRTVENLVQVHLLNKEARVQALYYTKYAGGQAVTGNQWDNTGGTCTTIEDDIDTAIETVKTNFGYKPNTVIMNDQTFKWLKKNATLRTLYKYVASSIGEVLDIPKLFASMFGLDNFLVAGAVYNSANKGASETLSRIWGKNVYISYIDPNPSLMSPSFVVDINTKQRQISNRRDEDVEGTVYKVKSKEDEKVICAEACECIKDVIA